MFELGAVLARLELCSVLLCWMQLTALGMERLRQLNNISALLPLWWLYWNSLLVTVEDRLPLGGSNVCFRSSARLATHVLQPSSKCKPVSGSTSALLSSIRSTIRNIGMLELAAVLARLGLRSVLLCWMELTALASNDCNLLLLISRRQSDNVSVLLPLWWLYWNSLLVTVEDRRPLGGSNVCFRSSAMLATHVLQSSSKCKPVSGAIIALPLVVSDPKYYLEHWDIGGSSRSRSSWTV